MNNAEFSKRVASQTFLPRAAADSAVNALFSATGEALSREEAVVIAGFGTFTIKKRDPRQGRNPRTGERIAIAASKAPAFMAGWALRYLLCDISSVHSVPWQR